jgi:hypothetical protein
LSNFVSLALGIAASVFRTEFRSSNRNTHYYLGGSMNNTHPIELRLDDMTGPQSSSVVEVFI